ncbi:MAG: hypothetical protein JKY34_16330 [Kordiimonadaceae bacterium]|nr:hypothetical protein [Kordiimonadaceae bacterium]
MVREHNKDLKQYGLLVIVLIIGVLVTWTATRESVRTSERAAVFALEHRSNLYVERVLTKLKGGMTSALDLDSFYQSGGQINNALFQRLVAADTNFKQHSNFVAISVEINPADRDRFNEAFIKSEGVPLVIRQPSGTVEPAQTMFPMFFIWSENEALKESLNGLNLGAKPLVRSFIEEALTLSEPSAIVLPSFPELDGGKSGWILAATPLHSKTGFKALIIQLVDFNSMVQSLLVDLEATTESSYAALSLKAVSSWAKGRNTTAFGKTVAEGEQIFSADKEVTLGAGRWLFTVSAPVGAMNIEYRTPIMTASVSLLLTGLFVFIFISQSQRADRIAGIVMRRTRALKEAHEELEDHYRLLQQMNVDVEEARNAAELANRTKSEFLATVSHELRTPLNAILGFSQLLSEQALGPMGDARYTDYARDIHSSGSHLLSLINDILDLAKLEAGQIKIEKIPVYIQPLMDKVVTLLSHQAGEKGIELYAEFAETMPECVVGDELRLRQILINLCSNAIKFTTEGSVVARFHLKPFKNGTDGWVMEVQDTGIGIPEEKQATLFDRFTQVDAALSRRHGGVGLGLAICRELVDRMDGRISVRSIPMIGTTIRVQLPFDPLPDSDSLVEDDNLI